MAPAYRRLRKFQINARDEEFLALVDKRKGCEPGARMGLERGVLAELGEVFRGVDVEGQVQVVENRGFAVSSAGQGGVALNAWRAEARRDGLRWSEEQGVGAFAVAAGA